MGGGGSIGKTGTAEAFPTGDAVASESVRPLDRK